MEKLDKGTIFNIVLVFYGATARGKGRLVMSHTNFHFHAAIEYISVRILYDRTTNPNFNKKLINV